MAYEIRAYEHSYEVGAWQISSQRVPASKIAPDILAAQTLSNLTQAINLILTKNPNPSTNLPQAFCTPLLLEMMLFWCVNVSMLDPDSQSPSNFCAPKICRKISSIRFICWNQHCDKAVLCAVWTDISVIHSMLILITLLYAHCKKPNAVF